MKKSGYILTLLAFYLLVFLATFSLFSYFIKLAIFENIIIQLIIGVVAVVIATGLLAWLILVENRRDEIAIKKQSVEEMANIAIKLPKKNVFDKDFSKTGDLLIKETAQTDNLNEKQSTIKVEENQQFEDDQDVINLFDNASNDNNDEVQEITASQDKFDFEPIVAKSYKDEETVEESLSETAIVKIVNSLSDEVTKLANENEEDVLEEQAFEKASAFAINKDELNVEVESELMDVEKQDNDQLNQEEEKVTDNENEPKPYINPQINLTDTQIYYINSSDNSYLNTQGFPQLVITAEMEKVQLDNSNLDFSVEETVQEVMDNEEYPFEDTKNEDTSEEVINTSENMVIDTPTVQMEVIDNTEVIIQQQPTFEETDTISKRIINQTTSNMRNLKELQQEQSRYEGVSDDDYYDYVSKENQLINVLTTILICIVIGCLAVAAYYIYSRYLV